MITKTLKGSIRVTIRDLYYNIEALMITNTISAVPYYSLYSIMCPKNTVLMIKVL